MRKTKSFKLETIDLDVEQKAIETKLKMKFGKPFYVNKNISLTPDGYEGPYITINNESWEEEDIKTLYHALFQAIKWCEEGYAPGAAC